MSFVLYADHFVLDPNAPKRGLSAYMFFANEQRENVREENPGIKFGEWTAFSNDRDPVCSSVLTPRSQARLVASWVSAGRLLTRSNALPTRQRLPPTRRDTRMRRLLTT